MQDVINQVSSAVGISSGQAEDALRIILNFLHRDGPTEVVERLAGEMGASDYLANAKSSGGGLLGSIGSMFGMGGAMAAFSELQKAGLDMEEIQSTVKTLIDLAREKIGDEDVNKIIGAIPGLSQLV